MSQIEDEAPTSIKEVGVHIAYMRRDIGTLTRLVEELPNGFATKEEMLSLEHRIQKLEEKGASFWIRFGIPTLSALSGAVLVVLVLSFLNRLK